MLLRCRVNLVYMIDAMIDAITQALNHADLWLFRAINSSGQMPWLDWLMTAITTTNNWRIVLIAGLVMLVWRGRREGRWCAATLVVGVGLADLASHHLLKETIHRLRPFEVLPDVVQLVGTGGGSFPSNHAMNLALAATVLGAYYPRWTFYFALIPLVVGVSRIYCGVHWPSYVLAGWLLGMGLGWCAVKLTQRWKGLPPARRL